MRDESPLLFLRPFWGRLETSGSHVILDKNFACQRGYIFLFQKGIKIECCKLFLLDRNLNRPLLLHPGPRIHSISIHGFRKIQGYQQGYYPWFFDVILQLSIQVWIYTLISKQGYQCKDILHWKSVKNEYPFMDIHVYGYQSLIILAFMDIHLDILGFLWISMY